MNNNTNGRNKRSSFFCKNACRKVNATFFLSVNVLTKILCNVCRNVTSRQQRAYVTMLLTLLCLPPSKLLDFIAWSFYKTKYTAKLLYITSSPKFGQHYDIEVLISVTIFRKAVPFKCNKFYLFIFL